MESAAPTPADLSEEARPSAPHAYTLTRWLFLRALGLIYFAAFVSLASQILGLYGSQGIAPISDYLGAVLGRFGSEAYRLLPSVLWLNASDPALQLVTVAGMIAALLLLVDFAPMLCTFVLWALYLSLVSAGQVFLSYQWDNLLLETGFLAIFLAPPHVIPRLSRQRSPAPINIWLFRWLLFRLMFSSGVVKLASGDPTWHNLTALEYHYWTQPLPTPLAWYANLLPDWFQHVSAAIMFVIELVFPFLIFGPRRLRFVAAGGLISLQVLILLTGNYTYFNFLTIALCLLLFDDTALRRLLPERWRLRFNPEPAPQPAYRRAIVILLAAVIVPFSAAQVGSQLARLPLMGGPMRVVASILGPLRVVNTYGLFAVMTTTRREIVVEGSDDGETWQAYSFKYKPGDVQRPPPWVEPFQPRLDWQMWFAALGSYEQNPWFSNFMVRLLQGSPDVLALLENNPFPDQPPRFIRAVSYDYHFTDWAERSQSGAWWRRTPAAEYFPAISLR